MPKTAPTAIGSLMPGSGMPKNTHGGKREGAGRKKVRTETAVLYVKVKPETIEKIDQLRGETSRGQFLDRHFECATRNETSTQEL